MTATAYVLLLLYWGGERGNAMTSVEFASKASCENALVLAEKKMSSGWTIAGWKVYGVCAPK